MNRNYNAMSDNELFEAIENQNKEYIENIKSNNVELQFKGSIYHYMNHLRVSNGKNPVSYDEMQAILELGNSNDVDNYIMANQMFKTLFEINDKTLI